MAAGGYPRGYAEAARFYRLAAATNAVAQNGLGEMIENGRTDAGGAPTNAVAARYYGLAARQGHVTAEANLGRLYFRGSGVAQDFDQAFRWLTLAANQGNAQAQYELGDLYGSGLGVARDEAEGQRLIKLAADRGNADALHSIAVTAFLKLAEQGDYDGDEQTTRLFAKALVAYQRDAAAGSTYAIRNVGEMYYLGDGVAQDFGVAYANFRNAADLGDVPALVEIGQMTERGDGVAKNEPEAARIYRECAAKGDAAAAFYLARMVETGRGGLKADQAEAIRLYKLADSRGDTQAYLELQRLEEAQKGAVPALPAGVQSVADYQPGWIGKTMVVRGTVSRFVQRDVNGEPYVYLYFKERPDSTVVACTRDDRWLLGVLGVDDFQSIVGRTLEFNLEVVPQPCTEQGASLWIWQRDQARIVKGGTR